ncbi:hypothetical protein RvY_10927 [Ramazzottius varieornatus]|uniref:Uncharacterized protein n=1 Tax=Ramazzottius varieornatus TaxID=947166 RepID=A0A1D1VED5_RAMVA|nr:hypothetical protein RvY_10927 [Ramazzottius varieornatus]
MKFSCLRFVCWFWIVCSIEEVCCGSTRLNITVVTYGSPKRFLSISLPYTAPAYQLAVEDIRDSFSFHVQQIFIQTENITTCQDLDSYSYLVPQYYYRERSPDSLFVIALPGCDELDTLGDLSREWNTMILSSGNSFGLKGRHYVRFPTAVSFSVINFDVWANCIAAILTRFQWTSISIIYDRWGSNSFYTMVVDKLVKLFGPAEHPELGFKIQLLPVSTTDAPVTHSVRQEALQRARDSSRSEFSVEYPTRN